MKLVFFSVVLNHHQAPVADAFYQLLGDDYVFVETTDIGDTKGSIEDYSKRPYLLRAWKDAKEYGKAMELAQTAEVCVFSGVAALPFQKERMKRGLMSFDMSERWLKRGIMNVFSPTILKMWMAYIWGRWNRKSLYKLCSGAYVATDQYKLGTFKNKCYKWGYFTKVTSDNIEKTSACDENEVVRMMWCARFIDWKHPEMPVELACRLREKGYRFHIDMYGDGPLRDKIQKRIYGKNLSEYISLKGNVPNESIQKAMSDSDIFLFTSDRQEGWGAVANEAMANRCCLVGADEIGAVPYLVHDGENGLVFKANSVGSLYEKVKMLLDNPSMIDVLSEQGYKDMADFWSPQNAARSLLTLIYDLQKGKDTSIMSGPCSKA